MSSEPQRTPKTIHMFNGTTGTDSCRLISHHGGHGSYLCSLREVCCERWCASACHGWHGLRVA